MLLALPLALAVLSAAPASQERTVTKASVYLLKDASFLSPRVSPQPLLRGQKVRLEGEQKGAWFLVSYAKTPKAKKVTGYIHASYLSDRPVAFKVEGKDVESKVQLSGNYNLAVPGFRQEVARKREQQAKDTRKGYAVVEQWMPLDVQNARVAQKLASPPEPDVLLAFLSEGRLKEPGALPPPEPTAEDEKDGEKEDVFPQHGGAAPKTAAEGSK